VIEPFFAVRATPHRIARLCGPAAASAVIASHDGWSRLDRDPGKVGGPTRAFACALSFEPGLRVVTYSPDGSSASGLDAAALPGGAGLLRRALTHSDPRYTERRRLADACHALGVPIGLLAAPTSPIPAASAPPAPSPTTGVVLAGPSARADAGLAGQSAWTVPVSPQWTLYFWDGEGRQTPTANAALALAGRHPAVACWWSGEAAGFVVVHGAKRIAGHQWGGGPAPITPESTAAAGRVLAADFGVPDQALAVIGLLRRTDLAPPDALASLFALLGLPGAGLGRATTASLAAWAATLPAAVHTARMTTMAAIRSEFAGARALWQRLLNGAVAVAMLLATAALTLVWHGGGISGWWVLLGALTTLSYAWGLRPRRS
jgi:hypothetical protein